MSNFSDVSFRWYKTQQNLGICKPAQYHSLLISLKNKTQLLIMSLRRSIYISYIWECDALHVFLLYVPDVSSMPTCFTNSRVCVPSSPCILHAFLFNVSYAPSLFICQTCFHFFTFLPFFACLTCLHFYIYLTYPQYLLPLFLFGALSAFLHFYVSYMPSSLYVSLLY